MRDHLKYHQLPFFWGFYFIWRNLVVKLALLRDACFLYELYEYLPAAGINSWRMAVSSWLVMTCPAARQLPFEISKATTTGYQSTRVPWYLCTEIPEFWSTSDWVPDNLITNTSPHFEMDINYLGLVCQLPIEMSKAASTPLCHLLIICREGKDWSKRCAHSLCLDIVSKPQNMR